MDKMREEFEKHYAGKLNFRRVIEGSKEIGYWSEITRAFFDDWQAYCAYQREKEAKNEHDIADEYKPVLWQEDKENN